MDEMSEASTVGVDLGGTKGIFIAGEHSERFDTGESFSTDAFVSRLMDFISRLDLPVRKVGIAVPGLVDSLGRVVACDVLPALVGWDPNEELARVGYQATALNDVRAALRKELHDAPPDITAGVVMAGTAIGAAFLAHGRPLLGASGWAGELGYLPVSKGGVVKRLDDVAGRAAMAAQRGVGAATLAKLASAAEPVALHAIAEGGRALGLGLATVINLLNPSYLAVGGGALHLSGYWSEAVAAAQELSIPELWRDCKLCQVRAGAQVVALGARRAATLA